MAQYGLTTNAEDLLIFTDSKQAFKDDLNPCELTQPKIFTALYEKFSYDCCLLFDSDTTTISQQAKRNRTQMHTNFGTLLSPLEATKQLVQWTSGHGPEDAKARFREKGVSLNVTFKTGSALALIYIPRLATKAAAALKLPDPWQRQPSAHDETMRQEIIECLADW